MSNLLKIDAGWAQIIGKRSYQQDSVMVMHWQDPFVLGIVADGMGGQKHGELASKEVVRVFSSHFCENSAESVLHRLSDALNAANNHIADKVENDNSLKGMGTTLLAVATNGKQLYWVSVGDSPCWLLRDGVITRLNQDHGFKVELKAQLLRNEITLDEFHNHPKRNQIMSAVVGKEISEIDLNEAEIQPEDILLLASDGVESLSPDDISRLCVGSENLTAKELASVVIEEVERLAINYQDNATLLILKISN